MIVKRIIFFSLTIIFFCCSLNGMNLYLEKEKRDLSSGSSSSPKKQRKTVQCNDDKEAPLEVTSVIEQLFKEGIIEAHPFHSKPVVTNDLKKKLEKEKGIIVVDRTLYSTLSQENLINLICGIKGYFDVKYKENKKEKDVIKDSDEQLKREKRNSSELSAGLLHGDRSQEIEVDDDIFALEL